VAFGLYYYFALRLGLLELGNSLAFGSLVAGQIFLIIFSREWEQVKSNKTLLVINGLNFIFLLLCFGLAPLRTVFHLLVLSTGQFIIMFGLPLITMLIAGISIRHLRS
jgi:hypothetical protein